MFMSTIDNLRVPAFTAKVTLLSLWLTVTRGWIYLRLTRRSSTRRRSKRPMESTDNNPARSKYYIAPRASESRYWRSKHRRSRQAEVQKPRRRPAKRSLQRADSFFRLAVTRLGRSFDGTPFANAS